MSNLRAWLREKSSEQTEHFLGEIPRLWLESGQINNLYSLLSNYDFIEAKINHRSFGVQALIEDYYLIDKTDLSNYLEHNSESIKCLKLIQQTLELSAHILAEDTTQLSSQLWGRLQHFQIPPIQQLLQTTKLSSKIWLRPLSSSLIPAGGRLQRILTGHTSAVNVATITSDAKRAISGAKDGALKVWDLQTGKELFSLKGHKSSVMSVVTTPDNKYIISSSEDETLRVWDFANGKELFKLADRDCIARSLAVTLDGRQVISVQWDKNVDITEVNDDFTKFIRFFNFLKLPINQVFKQRKKLNQLHYKNATPLIVTSWNLTIKTNEVLFKYDKDIDGFILDKHGKYLALFLTKIPEKRKTIYCIQVVDLEVINKCFILEGHTQAITVFTITLDNKYAVSGSKDKTLIVWNLETKKPQFTLIGHRDEITAVSITSDGKQAISVSKDKNIKIWNLELGKETDSINVHSDIITSLSISSDSKQLISSSKDKTLKIFTCKTFDTNTSPIIDDNDDYQTQDSNTDKNLFIIFAVVIFIFIIAAIIPFLILYHFILFVLIMTLPVVNSICKSTIKSNIIIYGDAHQKNQVSTTNFQGDENFINVYNYGLLLRQYLNLFSKFIKEEDINNFIQTRGFADFTQTICLSNHSDLITGLAINHNSRIIISSSNDKTIRLWDLETGKAVFIIHGHRDKITSIASVKNNLLISGSLDRTLMLWDLEAIRRKISLKSFDMFIYDFFYIFLSIALTIILFFIFFWTWNIHPVIGWIFTCSKLKLFIIFKFCIFFDNLIDGSDCDEYTKVAVTPDAKKVVSGCRDKTIKVWSLKSRRHILTLRGHTDWITSIAVTPDSKRVVSGSKDKTLKLWNLNTRKLIHTFYGHLSSINAVSITPDGLRVISGDSDGCLIIWDLLTRNKILTINAHSNSIEAIAVASYGNYFISASSDHTLKLWDLSSGEKIACFTADISLTSCIIAPDDSMIIAGDKAGQIHRLSLEGMMANL